jgi:hypothetical protein
LKRKLYLLKSERARLAARLVAPSTPLCLLASLFTMRSASLRFTGARRFSELGRKSLPRL